MSRVDEALLRLDRSTSARVRPALDWLLPRGGRSGGRPSPELLTDFLLRELPGWYAGDEREQHEVAWSLGDLFDETGEASLAALCRARHVHETLRVRRWVRSFPEVTDDFWAPAVGTVSAPVTVPARAALSLSSAHALLSVVGDGLELTADGTLPGSVVRGLDDRFRWTEEFPWMRPGRTGATPADIPPLSFLTEHLVAQRLLVRRSGRLLRTEHGVGCTRDTTLLWRAVVDPWPRWSNEFERDALGVLAAALLRSADFTLGRVGEQVARVLAAKWRPSGAAGDGPAHRSSVYDGASPVAQSWYQVGVPLGWWDTGRGAADRVPNVFGRAAAISLFRAVASGRRPGQPGG